MKKLIKLDFNNTTRERKTEDSYSELYSYDRNNGSFEFEILNDTLTTEQVTALFKFTESNKIWKTTGTVEGNKVNVTFDTSLITQNETVICYLYFDEEQRTSDTFRFKFKVKVSEIDKMSRYEVKERFINNTVIVDRLDVVTKTELQEALKNVGGIATEGLLTEVKAEEIYAKKSDAVDNTNFELVKNRVLALELKTDKDTVYDDSEVKERLTTLENKTPVDLSNYATKQELANVSGSQPLADNLVTKEELENRHYISDVSNLATKDELNEVRNSQPTVDTSHLVTRDELEGKGYLTEHQDLTPYALKSEIPQPYNDSPLNERVTALENRPAIGGSVDTSKFVTGELLESELEQLASSATKPLYIPYHHDTAKNYLDNTTTPSEKTFPDKRAGKILANVDKQNLENIQIFKGDENNSQFVDFDAAMYSLANSLPTDYSLESVRQDINNRVLFLSNKNFAEVVPKDELKNIIREVGGAGETVDTSHFITNEILESKNYLTQHQPLDNLVTKEELNSKGYVTDEALNSKGYLTEHQSLSHLATASDLEVLKNISVSKDELSKKVDTTDFNTFKDNVVTKTELVEKGFLTTHQDLSEYALKSELYNDSNLQFRFNSLDYDVRNSVDSLKKSVGDIEYKLRDYDSRISNLDSTISYSATKNELNDYVKHTELPAPYDDTGLRNEFYSVVNSVVDNELRSKENEFNSRFVAKEDLRRLVSEIVTELKSENN